MRFSFRLAELLNYSPDPRRRPGVIKAICDYTGLDRHQVAALLRNEVKHIPLDTLSRLCDFLVEHGHASPDQLPGALFAVEAENFWEMLARRKRFELCVGVRREAHDSSDGAWVVASDSILLGELLNGVSTLGGTAQLRQSQQNKWEQRIPHPEHLKQSLVWAPGQGLSEQVYDRANEVYDEFTKSDSDKALVALGSVKSNPVVELVLSSAFRCEPFKSQDDVSMPGHRACPFYIRYRDFDPHPESCCAGTRLSGWEATDESGIYYEDASGRWNLCPCDALRDAAFVFYLHRESQGWLEMALGGFSGRATRILAKTLSTRAEDFWPPVYEEFGLQVGAYIVQYTYAPQDARDRNVLRSEVVTSTKVIPLDREVLRHRLVPTQLKAAQKSR